MLASRYTLNLINQIKFEESDYELNDDIKNIIDNIALQVSEPEHNRASTFKKKKQIKNEDFKVTKRIEKTGIDALFNKIRINLNKITSSSKKTNECFKDDIAKYIIEIKNKYSDDWHENKMKINKFIIDIICTNHFYSNILVEVYSMLIDDFDLMNFLTDEIKLRDDFLYKLEWVDSNEDYDKFCENNKKNDTYRGYVLFLINIMKKGFISKNYLCEMVDKLLCQLNECILLDGNQGIVEEISELSFILVKNGYDELKEHDKWDSLYGDIKKILEFKAKNFKSLSNKTIFKFMDLNDYIVNKESNKNN
jgi:hypothetical protein